MAARSGARRSAFGSRMYVVDPVHFFRFFDYGNVEIHDHRLLTAAHEHAREWLVLVGVDFLVRDIGRYVNEIAGSGLGDELETIAPAHARASAHHVDHAFDRAVVVRAGLGFGMNHYRPRP